MSYSVRATSENTGWVLSIDGVGDARTAALGDTADRTVRDRLRRDGRPDWFTAQLDFEIVETPPAETPNSG